MSNRSVLFPVVLTLVAHLVTISAEAQVFEVRYTNRTTQTLTSPVCTLHRRGAALFVLGRAASAGLSALAEDGVTTTLMREARANKRVQVAGSGGFVTRNGTGTVQLRSSRLTGRISCVFGMLVATNDGFAAAQGIRLPAAVGETRRFRGMVYDAGSEINTESCDHVPGGPCDAHFVGLPENGTVQPHEGIAGIADLDSTSHGWPRVAVAGTVTRIE